MQREEDKVIEMGDGTHRARESVSNEEQLREKSESIIRPKRRAEAGSLEIEMDLRVGYSLAKWKNQLSGIRKRVNRAILGEFKIQEDVKTYIKLHE